MGDYAKIKKKNKQEIKQRCKEDTLHIKRENLINYESIINKETI